MTTTERPPAGTLGTFGGVFTPSILTILGLVLFLRVAYVIGAVGLTRSLLILVLATSVSVLTSISLAVGDNWGLLHLRNAATINPNCKALSSLRLVCLERQAILLGNYRYVHGTCMTNYFKSMKNAKTQGRKDNNRSRASVGEWPSSQNLW